MFRQMYLDRAEKKLGMELADASEEDLFVEFMTVQSDAGNIAQHFYHEGDELMVRLTMTEKGQREFARFTAEMN